MMIKKLFKSKLLEPNTFNHISEYQFLNRSTPFCIRAKEVDGQQIDIVIGNCILGEKLLKWGVFSLFTIILCTYILDNELGGIFVLMSILGMTLSLIGSFLLDDKLKITIDKSMDIMTIKGKIEYSQVYRQIDERIFTNNLRIGFVSIQNQYGQASVRLNICDLTSKTAISLGDIPYKHQNWLYKAFDEVFPGACHRDLQNNLKQLYYSNQLDNPPSDNSTPSSQPIPQSTSNSTAHKKKKGKNGRR